MVMLRTLIVFPIACSHMKLFCAVHSRALDTVKLGTTTYERLRDWTLTHSECQRFGHAWRAELRPTLTKALPPVATLPHSELICSSIVIASTDS